MESYGQFCPVAKASEVFGGRWTPLVLRELMLGSRRFNEIQRGVPLMSRTLLAQRLRELEGAGIVQSREKQAGRGREYALTAAGDALRPAITALSDWGQAHGGARLGPEDYDPAMLLWSIRRRIDPANLPEQRFVVRFEFRNVPQTRRSCDTWWLVLARAQADICLKNPGFEIDAVLSADIRAMTKVWLGYMGLDEAMRGGSMRIEAERPARQTLISLLDLQGEACPKAFTFAVPPPIVTALQSSAA